jgi:hypothetical protein
MSYLRTHGFKSGPRYEALVAQAQEQILLVSPPYSDKRTQEAFINGYETALSDFASGRIEIPDR